MDSQSTKLICARKFYLFDLKLVAKNEICNLNDVTNRM